MNTPALNRTEQFLYSHYFVTGLRLTAGVLLVFLVAYLFSSAVTASVAALGATYVAFIDRPAPMWPRVREMLAGALLGLIGVGLTGYTLANPLALTITMTSLAFVFSMLVVYGQRGATIGLACMTLAIITMPSGLSAEKVISYSSVSVAGALGYIFYSMLAGKLLQLREERQTLAVALYATAQYLKSRAQMYADGADINLGYRAMIATQTQMIAAHQAARDAMLAHMSSASVRASRTRLMLWNVLLDMFRLVDLVISTHTDYTLLQQQSSTAKARGLMHDALCSMASELEHIMTTVMRSKRHVPGGSAARRLNQLAQEIQAMNERGFAHDEPQTYVLCIQIHQRLVAMQDMIDRMTEQANMPSDAQALNTEFLDQPLDGFTSNQSYSPKLFLSNLNLNSSAFRYALRVSLAVAIAMIAGMYVPDAGAHGYWIVLTVIVIMKPAYSLSKQRNFDRLTGTLAGCALTFGLLHLTSDPHILLAVFIASLLLCFVFLVTVHYRTYSLFVSITVLLMLHAVFSETVNLPAERALDTAIGSLIALLCSLLFPWWESKSLPTLATAAIKANQKLLLSTIERLHQTNARTEQTELAWQTARHEAQIAYSNFAQGFARMMHEPASRHISAPEYSNLLMLAHAMSAQIVNAVHQAKADPGASRQIAQALEAVAQSFDTDDTRDNSQPIMDAAQESDQTWSYAIGQLQQATEQLLRTGQSINLFPKNMSD